MSPGRTALSSLVLGAAAHEEMKMFRYVRAKRWCIRSFQGATKCYHFVSFQIRSLMNEDSCGPRTGQGTCRLQEEKNITLTGMCTQTDDHYTPFSEILSATQLDPYPRRTHVQHYTLQRHRALSHPTKRPQSSKRRV